MPEPFDYSQCEVGDSVEVSTQLDFSKPAAGTISAKNNSSANIEYLDEAGVPRRLMFCWHESDARCKKPGRFEEAQRLLKGGGDGPPQTGIFRLTRNQNLLQGLPEKLAAMERLLQTVIVRLSNLEAAKRSSDPSQPPAEATAFPAESAPQKRGPGRPRKHAQPAKEAALA